MPIVTTMAAMAILRGAADEPQPFTDARALRRALRSGLSAEEPVLAEALAIADQLQRVLEDYQRRIEATLDEYIAASADRYRSAAEVIPQLAGLDREREQLLAEIVAVRQSLYQLLTAAQWEAVFGDAG